MQSARARKIDYVIVDTAGRLQTKANLMAEFIELYIRTLQVIIEYLSFIRLI